LHVMIADPNHSKRPGISSGVVRSATPEGTNGEHIETREAIRSKALGVLNIPDTFNQQRLKEIFAAYGPLVKVQLRHDHGGAIIEYENVSDAGKAELAADGLEIEPGRKIKIGSVAQLLQQRGEEKSGARKPATLMPVGPISRPNQPGRRGGLAPRKRIQVNGQANAVENGTSERGVMKGNAEFKAMFLGS
jgi:RNA recognition motif-containing protein